MSQTPEQPEAGGLNLRRALNDLPTHEPDPATWSRIEAQLSAQAALTRAVATLPEHEPDAFVWDTIAARLDEQAQVVSLPSTAPAATVRSLWPPKVLRRTLAIAASVLLLVGLWWQQRPAQLATSPRETVAVTQEEVATPLSLPAPTPDPLEQQGRSFIDAHCSSLPTVCQSGEFRALRTQLTEVESQEKQLRRDARRFGESPDLLRQQAQLVTLKATITRELVQLLIS
ncbi:anti-sigma factor [Hymenobacter sp. GOD-10R]|uniref:anti-sigma factor n=1 Tax=Hymenobacter sp. GOD-10R TaxID=3093922 RepID=UPI002D7998D1|nr:anti-sigma factor [Hymenobacter sp. GOD-10R]WRQ26581.1 anti-sigma factor [Hymenobacter sp. GOD-10R]